ncbi:MAG TPA: hypothetical protein VKV96_09620 [Roseiarcus sp.]|nr:hypothetical protein [Roseiarcus sp.]
MPKILLAAGALLASALAASSAYAIGGGPTPPWASPYAILEPQTVAPEAAAPFATVEGRSAYIGGKREGDWRGGDRERNRRSHRRAPAPEQ